MFSKWLWHLGQLLVFTTIMETSVIAEEASGTPVIVSAEIGIIGPSSKDILESIIARANAVNAKAILITLDTPGGQLTSTRQMVQMILNSSIPIIVWVGPSGARAASAGSFITMAADVAAMAPATNIGAAHPIAAGLTPTTNERDDTANKKILNDTIALAESIATIRGRNIEMARSFVLASDAITADDALANNVIDIIASNHFELLAKIHRRQIKRAQGDTVVLDTKNTSILHFQKNWRHKLLEIISDPNLFYLLFLAGIIGIGFELTHPGAIFPGVVGAICLLLAMTAMSILPVNYGGLGLILIGLALFVAELFVPSFGALGIGGFAAFFLGSMLLFDKESGLSISLWTILPTMLGIGFISAIIGGATIQALRSRVSTGQQGMVDRIGQTVLAHRDFIDGQGYVRLDGELWKAISPDKEKIFAGDRLMIKSIIGLEITIKKINQ